MGMPDLALQAAGLVLVVDDYEETQLMYEQWLAEAGFSVVTASNGVEALTKATIEGAPPDAVVMDLQMPEMDGFDATRRIRAALGASPYIIALSAFASDASRREAYEAGCDDFLAKPLTPDVLVTVLRAALRDRKRDSRPT